MATCGHRVHEAFNGDFGLPEVQSGHFGGHVFCSAIGLNLVLSAHLAVLPPSRFIHQG
jgi:hypothetical protein